MAEHRDSEIPREWTAPIHDAFARNYSPKENWLACQKILFHVSASKCEVKVIIKAETVSFNNGPSRLVFTVQAKLTSPDVNGTRISPYVAVKTHVEPDVATRGVLEAVGRITDGFILCAYSHSKYEEEEDAPRAYLPVIVTSFSMIPDWWANPSQVPDNLRGRYQLLFSAKVDEIGIRSN